MIFDIENIVCNKCKQEILYDKHYYSHRTYRIYYCKSKCSNFYSEHNYFSISIETFCFEKFKKGIKAFKSIRTPKDFDFELFELLIKNKYKDISNYKYISQLHSDLISTINLFKENSIFY